MSTANEGEQREHHRYQVTAYVDLTGSEVLLYHQVGNISLGGISVNMEQAAALGAEALEQIGTHVDLVIHLPSIDATVAAQGEVVWANSEPPADMGVRFVELDSERVQVLQRFLERTGRGQ